MAELGIPISFSKSSHANIKITTKEDLELFEGFVLAKKKKVKNNLYKRFQLNSFQETKETKW